MTHKNIEQALSDHWVAYTREEKGDDPSGDSAHIKSSSYFAHIGSSGDSAHIKSSGDDAQIGSSGDSAHIKSSGDDAQIGSSGNAAHIESYGNFAHIGSSGNFAHIESYGDDAQIGLAGKSIQIDSTGKNAVIVSAGRRAVVKAKKGTWLSLAEYDRDGKCTGFATGCIGEDGLRPDTWYTAKNGKLVEQPPL